MRTLRTAVTLASLAASVALVGCDRSDRDTHAEAAVKLAMDSVLQEFSLELEVQNGVVRVRGETSSLDQQKQAIALLEGISGVKHVISEMRISDAVIAEAVQQALADDPILRTLDLSVSVHRAVVRLASADTDATQRERAVAIVRRIDGVAGVDDYMR